MEFTGLNSFILDEYFEIVIITLFIVFLCCTLCVCLCRHDVLTIRDLLLIPDDFVR